MSFSKLLLLFILCFWATNSWGLEIYLKNGDKVTGQVTKDDGTYLFVQTLAVGKIRIDKAFIDLPKTYPQEYSPPKFPQQVVVATPPPVVWKKDMSLGYTQTGGDTNKQLGQIAADLDRKTKFNETTLKFNAFYSSTNDLMDGKKFYGMARYAYSFGKDLVLILSSH